MASVVVRRPSSVNIFSSRTTEPILTILWYVASVGKETRNCKFHDSQGRDSCAKAWPCTCKSYSEKCIISLKIFYSSKFWAWIRQTKYVVMINKEGSNKIFNFYDPWGRGFSAQKVGVAFYFFYMKNMFC